MLERTTSSRSRATEQRCAALLEQDVDVDVLLMVGVGAANAGGWSSTAEPWPSLLEHFTSVATPTPRPRARPELLPLWLAHEIAHGIRYTSARQPQRAAHPDRRAGGYYSYWDTGRQASLRELLVNEGLAVHASQVITPPRGVGVLRLRAAPVSARPQLETVIGRAVVEDLEPRGAGPSPALPLRHERRGRTGTATPSRAQRLLPRRAPRRAGDEERGLRVAVRASSSELAQPPAPRPPRPSATPDAPARRAGPSRDPAATGLLAHAEPAEDGVEHVVRPHRADQPLQRGAARARASRDARRQRALAPGAANARSSPPLPTPPPDASPGHARGRRVPGRRAPPPAATRRAQQVGEPPAP